MEGIFRWILCLGSRNDWESGSRNLKSLGTWRCRDQICLLKTMLGIRAHFTKQGSLYYQPKECTIKGEILQIDHAFIMFHSSQMGNLMIPAKAKFFSNAKGQGWPSSCHILSVKIWAFKGCLFQKWIVLWSKFSSSHYINSWKVIGTICNLNRKAPHSSTMNNCSTSCWSTEKTLTI